ncbi:hypothetical protein DNTS_007718, partial [Danionella cerebrum]
STFTGLIEPSNLRLKEAHLHPYGLLRGARKAAGDCSMETGEARARLIKPPHYLFPPLPHADHITPSQALAKLQSADDGKVYTALTHGLTRAALFCKVLRHPDIPLVCNDITSLCEDRLCEVTGSCLTSSILADEGRVLFLKPQRKALSQDWKCKGTPSFWEAATVEDPTISKLTQLELATHPTIRPIHHSKGPRSLPDCLHCFLLEDPSEWACFLKEFSSFLSHPPLSHWIQAERVMSSLLGFSTAPLAHVTLGLKLASVKLSSNSLPPPSVKTSCSPAWSNLERVSAIPMDGTYLTCLASFTRTQTTSDQTSAGSRQWTQSGAETSRATVYSCLQEMGYRCRIPQVKPLLNQKQQQKHLTWATEKQHWTVAQILPVVRNSSVKKPQSVMVWGAMSDADVGPLCFIKGRTTGKWLTDYGIAMLQLNLNPIENLWEFVKRKLRDPRPNTLEELKAAIEASWASLSSATEDFSHDTSGSSGRYLGNFDGPEQTQANLQTVESVVRGNTQRKPIQARREHANSSEDRLPGLELATFQFDKP